MKLILLSTDLLNGSMKLVVISRWNIEVVRCVSTALESLLSVIYSCIALCMGKVFQCYFVINHYFFI
jgi:hypothetical protein